MSTSEQEPLPCIVKNSGTSKVNYTLFFQGALPFLFLLFCSFPFLLSALPPTSPPRLLAIGIMGFGKTDWHLVLSQIFPWRWTAQIVTAAGPWKISVVWNHLERIEIILWAEIILLVKDFLPKGLLSSQHQFDNLTAKKDWGCGITLNLASLYHDVIA